MAERVEGDLTNALTGKYPWREWFDGSTWKLTKGEDFTVAVGDMRSTAFATATRRGLKIRTRIDGDVLYIQAYRADASGQAVR